MSTVCNSSMQQIVLAFKGPTLCARAPEYTGRHLSSIDATLRDVETTAACIVEEKRLHEARCEEAGSIVGIAVSVFSCCTEMFTLL